MTFVPGGPWSPVKPLSPSMPLGPGGPVTPAGPVWPWFPNIPGRPSTPTLPGIPLKPLGPSLPGSPTGPKEKKVQMSSHQGVIILKKYHPTNTWDRVVFNRAQLRSHIDILLNDVILILSGTRAVLPNWMSKVKTLADHYDNCNNLFGAPILLHGN